MGDSQDSHPHPLQRQRRKKYSVSMWRELAQEILSCGNLLSEKGLIAGTAGNISLRLSDGRILITPAGIRKGALSQEDIVTLTPGDDPDFIAALRPSSELDMHLTVYQYREDLHACIHSHAPYATAYGVAGIEPEIDVLPEVSVFVGRIALTDYAPPGTPAVGESLKPFLSDCNAFLLKNHGLLTSGRTIAEALNRHEIVEQYLKILTLAKSLGNVDHLDPGEIERLRKSASDV